MNGSLRTRYLIGSCLGDLPSMTGFVKRSFHVPLPQVDEAA